MVWTTDYFNPTKQLVIAPKPNWLDANGSEIEHNAVNCFMHKNLYFKHSPHSAWSMTGVYFTDMIDPSANKIDQTVLELEL